MEKHQSWGMSAEGFGNHVTTDDSLLGVPGRWGACGWSVVQLDHDEKMRPMHGMYGTLDAKLEMQRTVKRAELTAFLCLSGEVIGPTMVHCDNTGIVGWAVEGRNEVHWPKSEGRRLVDLDLERIAQSTPRRHIGEGRARQRASLSRRKSSKCRSSKNHY